MAEPLGIVGCPRCAELESQLAAARAEIAQLKARLARLEKLVDARTRDGKRQAAPFSKGEPKENPEKPGRKPGEDYGTKAFRALPEGPPDQVIDVPTPKSCPRCGGRVRETQIAEQFQFEIPRRPIVRRFDLHIGECTCCGKRVQPRHEWQTSDALGAASVQIGPEAQSLIALMKNRHGLSYGDISELMKDGFGLPLDRSAAAHIVRRAGERAEPMYHAIQGLVRRSDTVYPDETGWKIGGRKSWMWDFVTNACTLYVIRPSRGVGVLSEVLGMDYAGRMTHDGWSVYNRLRQATHQQCLQHLLRRAHEIIEQLGARTARFAVKTRDFILNALTLRDRKNSGQISEHGFAVARGITRNRLRGLLSAAPKNKVCRTFRNHMKNHENEILTFLDVENLEATNWPAEQAIRPAVVNRKVSGGNRTPTGAHALEVLASLFATCRQNALDTLTTLSHFLRTPASRSITLPAPAP